MTAPQRTPPTEPLRVWTDWSCGIGTLRDDGGRTPGMYTATSILGLSGELRPAPHKFSVDYSAVVATDEGWVADYFFEQSNYIYAILNNTAADDVRVLKVDGRNATFANTQQSDSMAPTSATGQPAFYKGKWYLTYRHTTTATINIIKQLTTIGNMGVTTDTWTAGGNNTGGEHLANLNFQLAQTRSSSGVRILGRDGVPTTDADWGSFFPVGDVDENVAALAEAEGAVFVMGERGLYSFNNKGRSGLVFADHKTWRTGFVRVQMAEWRGGLLIPAPSGLIYYPVGGAPVEIGLNVSRGQQGTPPPGPTELGVGVYHSVQTMGDYVYLTYQPDVTSTAALVLVGQPQNLGDPTSCGWQAVAATTLEAVNRANGVGLSRAANPESANYRGTSLWFPDESTSPRRLSYMILNRSGSPYRARSEQHRITTSGDAYMSELFFDTPVDLSHVVVITQDMASGDEWRISGIDNAGTDLVYGAPIVGNGRHVRELGRKNVYRFMLHLKWTATDTAIRNPPAIKRLEIWGRAK